MDANEALNKAILLNREDARQLVKTLEAAGDSENARQAREDLRKWEEKARLRGME